ncbi:hypothetical protein BDU57DRAFT_543609 [Ampelomyces quisqualis]|uniref:Uncharacterized protein n=1 Tax=Ampelomyces quisqualis TaxID=50730 RepID=A0A6A5Q7T2_AMPQU|nr:hypothetical protein BDU57DRAFT_543609 [Ampelomyces quisqualis]
MRLIPSPPPSMRNHQPVYAPAPDFKAKAEDQTISDVEAELAFVNARLQHTADKRAEENMGKPRTSPPSTPCPTSSAALASSSSSSLTSTSANFVPNHASRGTRAPAVGLWPTRQHRCLPSRRVRTSPIPVSMNGTGRPNRKLLSAFETPAPNPPRRASGAAH